MVAGSANVGGGTTREDFGIARFLTDGSLDTTYGGGDGVDTTDIDRADEGYGLALDGAGRAIIVGTVRGRDIGVARYTTGGAEDAAFNGAGTVQVNLGSNNEGGRGVTVQSDDKIYAVGYSGSGGNQAVAVARLLTNGAFDTTWGGNGSVTQALTGAGDMGMAIALQADNKPVVAAEAGGNFQILRFLTSGIIDTTFDGDGISITDMGGTETAASITVESTGKILVVGSSGNDVAIARYLTDGTLDTTFGTTGYITQATGTTDAGNGIQILPDGRLLTSGTSGNDFLVTRVFP